MMKYRIFFFFSFFLFFLSSEANAQVVYAKNFNYFKEDGAYRVIIQKKQNEKIQYLIPENEKATFVLNYVSESAFLDALNDTKSILAIINPQYVYNEKIQDLLKKGAILPIVSSDNAPPVELILKLNPSFYSLDIFSKENSPLKILSSNGIKIITPVYFLEKTPLAKAEWIKFYGILSGDLKKAEIIFKQIEKSYLEKKMWVAKYSKEKPSVILGLPYQGIWYTASPSSLAAKFIEDAGGLYFVKEFEKKRKLASLSLSQEDLIKAIPKTDVWIIKTNEHLTKKILLERYPYLKQISSFAHVRVYNSSKRTHGQANDIFESADLHVEKVLSDMISILHPDLNKGSELTYYEEVL